MVLFLGQEPLKPGQRQFHGPQLYKEAKSVQPRHESLCQVKLAGLALRRLIFQL